MKRTSNPEVQPRRDLLAALGVSAVTMLGAPQLMAATEDAMKSCEAKYQFTLLFGRLCVDAQFQKDFLGAPDANQAMAVLKKYKMHMSVAMKKWIGQFFGDQKQLNDLRGAWKALEGLLMSRDKMPPPCNPWPC